MTMSEEMKLDQFDSWFNDEGPAALVIVEPLQSVVEDHAVIFPPTYAPEQSSSSKKSEYVIDPLKDGHNVCQIDSVGSQANRLEPIFKLPIYDKLVPQVTVEVDGGHRVNLLDAGHRAADAIVRFSSLSGRLSKGFEAWLTGDASKLAAIAPTSLLFGAWDSRGTQAKTPRILSSIIRAYDVELLTRSATYIPAVDYAELGVVPEELSEKEKGEKRTDSQLGLVNANSSRAAGGVLVQGEIRREATLNLVSLRAIGAVEHDTLDLEKTLALRRYMLGLALVAVTKPLIHNLRQGCLLVGVESKPAMWKLVYADGKRVEFKLGHPAALAYAQRAAEGFRKVFPVEKMDDGGFKDIPGEFDPTLAKAAADEKTAKKEATKAKKTRGKSTGNEEAAPKQES
jgi:CRISPR-associated protein Csb1